MRFHPAWIAAGLLLSVVLACNLGKTRNANLSTNSGSTNSNSSSSTAATADAGPGNYISEIHMAKDDGSGDPGDEVSSFGPGDRTIHCVTRLKDAKSGTQMKFSWWIVDADGAKNEKIKDINYTTKSFENVVHGHLTLPQDWPKGKYKVEVYVNGELDRAINYGVQ
jgi:hypothetical protein